MKESELQNAIGSLPHSIKPQRDLWPGIHQQIGMAEKAGMVRYKTPLWRTPAMAAAVLLALTSGIFIGRGMDAGPSGQSAHSMLEYTLLGTVTATEREYRAAFRELLALDYSGLRLKGEQPDALRGSWQDLQQAESSLLAALAQYPSNLYLNGKLLDLRSQQLHFVKRLILLEQNNWRRT